ncbi:MAG: hypothetical protein V7K64_32685 [Nostoc sp.]|uniref:hypothetical protein n=1 Tax=unclassified Nostoc TaxID=2593658 RepID=UPI002FF45C44
MDSKTVQPTLIDAETLKQLEDEIKQEMSEILNKSNLNQILEKYSMSGEKLLKIQCSIHLAQNESRDTNSFLPFSDRPILIPFNCLCNGRPCQC